MRPNTYCKGCRKPTLEKICHKCKLKSIIFLYQEFNLIIGEPDMVAFATAMQNWYLYKDSA